MQKEYKTLKEVRDAMAEINKEYDKLGLLSYNLGEIEQSLRTKDIIDSKILSKAKWEVCINVDNKLYLDGVSGYDTIYTIQEDYHETITITDTISLRFDDSDFYLRFDDQSLIKQFIDDNNLKVNTNPNKLKKLKSDRDDMDIKIKEYDKLLEYLK